MFALVVSDDAVLLLTGGSPVLVVVVESVDNVKFWALVDGREDKVKEVEWWPAIDVVVTPGALLIDEEM